MNKERITLEINKGDAITISDLRDGMTILSGIVDKFGETKGSLSYIQLNTGWQITINEEE